MRALSLVFVALFALAAPALAFDARDRTFEPGRVGAIIKGKTKPADLARIYGEENVKPTTLTELGGGDTFPGVFIHPETPNALEVGFSGDGKDIVYVSIQGKNWTSKSGLRIGAGRAVLERINGRPFRFYGTGFDYSGLVQETGPALKRYSIHVRPIPNAGRPAEYFMGEKLFSSRDPALKDLEVFIIQVSLGAGPD